jgi:DNA repair protein RadC
MTSAAAEGGAEAPNRRKSETYKGWRIDSHPYSHLGTRMYEAGIYGPGGLADVAHGKTRPAVIAAAQKKIDDHEAGIKLLNNLRPEVVGAQEFSSSSHSCSTGTCQPFTTLVRDEAKFNACMALAAEIGELSSSKNVVKLIRGHMGKQDQEIFIVVTLDMRGQLRDFVEVGRGQRHRVATDIEDIIRPIILSGCDGAIVAHCHPSGKAEPSDADDDLTQSIKKGMAVACPTIKFLDHLIVTPFESYSFADNGWKGSGKVEKA